MVKKSVIAGSICLFFIIAFLLNSDALINSATEGLLISAKIIIPSLFPFTALTLFLFKSDFLNSIGNILEPITKRVFGVNGRLFCVILMSFIGGFPVGAKLINELYSEKSVSEKTANRMLYYCVNPGPAFVIIGIGQAIFHRTDIGLIIYASNIAASLIICFMYSFKEKKEAEIQTNIHKERNNIADIFVNSVAEASASIISICAFIVLFSTIIGIVKDLFTSHEIDPIIALLEVSNGTVIFSENLYAISFLTAFSGICVHAQILSACKEIKINYLLFLVNRVLCGVISLIITVILVKLFKPGIETLSLNSEYIFQVSNKTIMLSVALILMCLTLLISIKQNFVEKRR